MESKKNHSESPSQTQLKKLIEQYLFEEKKKGLGILKKYLRAGALRDEIIKEKLEKENTEGEEG